MTRPDLKLLTALILIGALMFAPVLRAQTISPAPIPVTITPTSITGGAGGFNIFSGTNYDQVKLNGEFGCSIYACSFPAGMNVVLTGGGAVQINGSTSGAAYLITNSAGFVLQASEDGSTPAGAFALSGFTVATLPQFGVTGTMAYVTDALTCTFQVTPTGSHSTFCPVIYNGSAWVAF